MGYKDRATQRQYQRDWLRARRRGWLLANGPCVDCGSWGDGPDGLDGLEIDHAFGVKVSHRLWSWSPERRAIELAKCEVRCGNGRCHYRVSVERGQFHRSARLCPDDVIAARLMRRSGMPATRLAEVFDVHLATMRAALAARTWRDVDELGGDAAGRAAQIGRLLPLRSTAA
jgi:hypothetical protein